MSDTLHTDLNNRYRAAGAAAKAGDTARARALYLALATDNPENKPLITKAALDLTALGYTDEAIELLQTAADRMGNSPALLKWLAHILTATDRWTAAAAVLEQMSKSQDHEDLSTLLEWGRVSNIAGLHADAMRAYERAIILDSNSHTAEIGKGEALEKMGRSTDAATAYRRALAIKPNAVFAALSLGGLLVDSDNLDEAETVLRTIVTRYPSVIEGHVGLCALLIKRRNLIEALTAADAAIALDGQSVTGHRARGAVLLEMNQPTLSAASFRRGLAINPNDIDSLMGIGSAEAKQGHYTAAVDYMRQILAIDPTHAIAQHLATTWAGGPAKQKSSPKARKMFSGRSYTLDRSLVKDLRYRIPQEAVDLLMTVAPARDQFRNALDLVCAAGLGTAALIEKYDIPTRIGVDASFRMLRGDAAQSLYTHRVKGRMPGVLDTLEGTFDLIIMLEGLLYVGDLKDTFAGIAARLAPGGLFIYSIETSAKDDFKLMTTGRYVHAIAYTERVAAAHDLSPRAGKAIVVRTENGGAVPGHIGILARQ